MRLALRFFLLLATAAPILSAQTAKVVVLSPEDAATAKSLYAQQAEVEKKIADLRVKIKKTYLIVPEKQAGSRPTEQTGLWVDGDGESSLVNVIQGFPSADFEFSEDFRFIVPANRQTPLLTTNQGRCYYSVSPIVGTYTSIQPGK